MAASSSSVGDFSRMMGSMSMSRVDAGTTLLQGGGRKDPLSVISVFAKQQVAHPTDLKVLNLQVEDPEDDFLRESFKSSSLSVLSHHSKQQTRRALGLSQIEEEDYPTDRVNALNVTATSAVESSQIELLDFVIDKPVVDSSRNNVDRPL